MLKKYSIIKHNIYYAKRYSGSGRDLEGSSASGVCHLMDRIFSLLHIIWDKNPWIRHYSAQRTQS